MEMGKMIWGWLIALVVVVLILSASNVYSADWFLYDQNDTIHQRFYIDKGSIQMTPEGTILVWRKTVSIDPTTPQVTIPDTWVEELDEVDCSRRRFKILQGTVFRPGYREIAPANDWSYFTPDDASSTLFITACGKGKKK